MRNFELLFGRENLISKHKMDANLQTLQVPHRGSFARDTNVFTQATIEIVNQCNALLQRNVVAIRLNHKNLWSEVWDKNP